MRGYGYTRSQALAEPVLSFFALLGALSKLEAEEDLRGLMVAGVGAKPGEKGEAFGKLADALRAQAGHKPTDRTVSPERQLRPGMPGVIAVEPGALAQERLAREAHADEIRKQWLQRLGRGPDNAG